MGVWSGFGEKVKQQTLVIQQKQRKYLVQSSPKTNGVFIANWKAPATDIGKIKFYFAGLAINQNGNTNGDNNVFGQLTLNSPSTSSYNEPERANDIKLYPNPAHDYISISHEAVESVTMIGLAGSFAYNMDGVNKTLDISNLANGFYVAILKDKNGNILLVRKFIKL
jgi:hypothetical protein